MNKYKVKITDSALTDMEAIYNYIAEQLLVPDIAMEQYNRIADAILSLGEYPERYRCLELSHEEKTNLRRMPVDNYSVFYTIIDDTVYATDVLYSASDIENKLKGI